MQGSFLDFFPPEANAYVGAIGLITAAVGIIVWSSGIKIARFCVSMLCGIAGATLAALLIPKFLFVSPLSCALVGFAIGAVTGALAFRLLQGLVLAICIGLAVSAVYYHWHVSPVLPATPTAQTLPASLTATATKAATDLATDFVKNLSDRWAAIPNVHQKRLMAAGIGTAAVILLIAFGFARHTTLLVSALLGSLMIAAGLQTLVQIYAPNYQQIFQIAPLWRYLTLAGMTLLGMALQHHFHWPRRPKPAAPIPVPAVPTPEK